MKYAFDIVYSLSETEGPGEEWKYIYNVYFSLLGNYSPKGTEKTKE